MTIIFILFLIAAIAAFIESLFEKPTFIFTGNMGPDFHMAGNWSTRLVPGPNDNIFLVGGPKKVVISTPLVAHDFIAKGFPGKIIIAANLTVSGSIEMGSNTGFIGSKNVVLTSRGIKWHGLKK